MRPPRAVSSWCRARLTLSRFQAYRGAGVTEARRTCAIRDLALITMLEDRGSVVSSELLDRTFGEMIRAREACQDSRFAEALIMYDTALLKLKAD